jgi:hypothetical protein
MRLQDYSDEVSNDRTYAGFHNRFPTDVGKDMGKKIGELTSGTRLVGSVAAAQAETLTANELAACVHSNARAVRYVNHLRWRRRR